MKYVSTRSTQNISKNKEGIPACFSFSDTLLKGLAPDGGLFVPTHFPEFNNSNELAQMSSQLFSLSSPQALIPHTMAHFLRPFLKDDPLEPFLNEICEKALSFPLPLRELDKETSLLELFHGPTAAFKDLGARFLSGFLSQLGTLKNIKFHIVVATSGDTGGAVASAFHKQKNVRVTLLYPEGGVSSLQEKQLTIWDDNVKSLAVKGTFDDCQRLVKNILSLDHTQLPKSLQNEFLTSANSISLGRLLPQMIFYIQASLIHYHAKGRKAQFIIPTGNLGNAVSALYAREMGFPIGNIVLSQNANHPIVNYLISRKWSPQPSIKTLANAMDVGNPSNFERLQQLYPQFEVLQSQIQAYAVSDEEITSTIREEWHKRNLLICPHTATAMWVRTHILPYAHTQTHAHIQAQTQTQNQNQNFKISHSSHWVVVATAHPAKFADTLEPIIKTPLTFPFQLKELLTHTSHKHVIDNNIESLIKVM